MVQEKKCVAVTHLGLKPGDPSFECEGPVTEYPDIGLACQAHFRMIMDLVNQTNTMPSNQHVQVVDNSR